MKVTVKQQPEEFKPVTLEITLQSQKEIEIMYAIANKSCTFFDKLGFKHTDIYNTTLELFDTLKPFANEEI